jgi:hypothetical protein
MAEIDLTQDEEARLGALTTDKERFSPWKSIDWSMPPGTGNNAPA